MKLWRVLFSHQFKLNSVDKTCFQKTVAKPGDMEILFQLDFFMYNL